MVRPVSKRVVTRTITRNTFGERVLALIEAAAVEGETDRLMTSTASARCFAALNLPVIGSVGRCS